MSSLQNQIIAIYPNYKEEINQIFQTNELFVELVNDYLFCKNKLKCRSSNTNEYRDALKDLENEIIEQIDNQKQKINSN